MVQNTSVEYDVTPTESKATRWGQADRRINDLYEAARSPRAANARTVILLAASSHPEHRRLHTAFEETVREGGGVCVVLSSLQAGLSSFWAIRTLLEHVAPMIAAEAPELLNRYAAELEVVHPALAARLGVVPALPLSKIGLTPSERRSHRESEQAFRIINGLCELLIGAQHRCPSFNGQPLAIWWMDLQAADRPSLLAFRRLSRWADQARAPILLIGTLDPHGPSAPGAQLPAEVAPAADWRATHRQLIDQIRAQIPAEEIDLLDEAPDGKLRAPALGHQDGDGALEPTAPHSAAPLDEAIAMERALLAFERGLWAEGSAYALYAMRQAFFLLNIDAILLLGQHVVAGLETLDDAHFASERFESLWKQLTPHDTYVAIEFGLTDLQSRRDVLITVWKAIALAQTFLEHHQAALECYQRALALADEPAVRAEISMYIALITSKRLREIERAWELLDDGRRLIEGRTDMKACLERGWLLNVSALTAYQTKRYRDAMKMVQEALAQVKPFHQSEATHLKINLVSNISVLQEDTNQLEGALKTWLFFRSFLKTANELFAKHYHYREGGLRFKMGDLGGALASYQQSYTHAQAIGDSFHAEIAAQACGYVSYQLDRLADAETWYARSVELREQIGDFEKLAESLLAQALCAYRQEQSATARALVERAEQLQAGLAALPRDDLDAARRCLDQPTPQHDEAWERGALRSPGTKLNRPFYLTNLYAAR